MKITRYRNHKINTGEKTYESHDFGATVEFDTEADDLPKEYKPDEVNEYLDDFLDDILAPAINRLVESNTLIANSHVLDYYDIT